MTVTEQRVRELIAEERSSGCTVWLCNLLALAVVFHFWWSEDGLPGLIYRLGAVLFGQTSP